MTSRADRISRNKRTGRLVSAGLAAAAGVTAAITLIGYITGTARLIGFRPNWQAMSVSTALLSLLLAGALTADAFERDRITRRMGLAALIFSGVLLSVIAYDGYDAVSPALQAAMSRWPGQGKSSPATVLCTGLLAVGCFGRPQSQPAGTLAITVMVVSGIAVLGYAYGVEDLYALSPFRTMSLRTALTLFALATGFLLSNHENGVSALLLERSVTGGTTRRQLGFLLIPPVAAWGLLRATSANEMGPGAAMAFLVMLTVGPLAMLILRDARTLTRLDAERLDKRQSDKAKLAVERRYRTLFNRLETGFCIIEVKFDTAGKPVDYVFLEVNPAFASHTGLLSAEGRWIRELTPDVEQHRIDLYGRVAMTGEPARVEYDAASLNRHFDVSAFRVDDPDARHVAVLIIDITARKRAELDMKAMNETLERRVSERAAELEQAQDALRQAQKLEAIGQLTGGVAHDFNNLLTVIQGSVDLLKRPNLTEDRRLRFTDAIGEAAGRAAKLTGQLLAFARRQSLTPETFDIGKSLEEAMSIIGSLTGAGIMLDLKLPAQPCFVLADRSQFDTAILNMAINARDAMHGEGRIEITAGTVSGMPSIRTHTPVPGDFVVVTIKDSGSGIAPNRLASIFEPFFTTKETGSGTGLGLSQVFGFAKQSGGDVRVESVEGEGAVFTLYLPREYAEPVTRREFAPEANLAGDGIRVLVVEDNLDVGAFALQSLAELGYRTELAHDAEQALALLSADRSRFDIVFSDVVMPGRSGLELAGDIRTRYPGLPVVLTSGYSHVLSQNGAHGFELLHKPYSIEQLSRVLRRVLTWAETARDERAAE